MYLETQKICILVYKYVFKYVYLETKIGITFSKVNCNNIDKMILKLSQ
jgi:hypothetical protein